MNHINMFRNVSLEKGRFYIHFIVSFADSFSQNFIIKFRDEPSNLMICTVQHPFCIPFDQSLLLSMEQEDHFTIVNFIIKFFN